MLQLVQRLKLVLINSPLTIVLDFPHLGVGRLFILGSQEPQLFFFCQTLIASLSHFVLLLGISSKRYLSNLVSSRCVLLSILCRHP